MRKILENCYLWEFTVKTITLGGFNLEPIFDVRKLKNHIYASFSSYRCNPSIIKSSFYRYASSLVACERPAVAASLQLELSQDTIVHRMGVSLRQVQRIKHNLVVHSSVRKPKVVQQGRSLKLRLKWRK